MTGLPRVPSSTARCGLAALAVSLLLTACAQAPTSPSADALALERRLQALEGRLDLLERFLTAIPAPPLRPRGEIEQHIRELEARRLDLLARVTPAHPAVREVDLSLRLLRLQLELLDQAQQNPR